MSQAIFSVPGALHCITYVIAPINAFLNWCFGVQSIHLPRVPVAKTAFVVYHQVGLGFPGAPIATSLSFNLVYHVFILYGYFFPHTAWVLFARIGVWKKWGILVRLA